MKLLDAIELFNNLEIKNEDIAIVPELALLSIEFMIEIKGLLNNHYPVVNYEVEYSPMFHIKIETNKHNIPFGIFVRFLMPIDEKIVPDMTLEAIYQMTLDYLGIQKNLKWGESILANDKIINTLSKIKLNKNK